MKVCLYLFMHCCIKKQWYLNLLLQKDPSASLNGIFPFSQHVMHGWNSLIWKIFFSSLLWLTCRRVCRIFMQPYYQTDISYDGFHFHFTVFSLDHIILFKSLWAEIIPSPVIHYDYCYYHCCCHVNIKGAIYYSTEQSERKHYHKLCTLSINDR